jgi:hypothetical protein
VDYVPDGRGENGFYTRAYNEIMEYLNRLGSEGWKVVSVRAGTPDPDQCPLPEGRYLLMKELEDA